MPPPWCRYRYRDIFGHSEFAVAGAQVLLCLPSDRRHAFWCPLCLCRKMSRLACWEALIPGGLHEDAPNITRFLCLRSIVPCIYSICCKICKVYLRKFDKGEIESRTNPDRISTSDIERQNLTLRMLKCRFTRLTDPFSKEVEDHAPSFTL